PEGVDLLHVVEQSAGENGDPRAVCLVEVVATPEAEARVDDALRLSRRVPDMKVLVDELFEDAVLETDPRRDDDVRLRPRRDALQDSARRGDGVCAVGAEVVALSPFVRGERPELLEEVAHRSDVDGGAS